MFRTRFVCDIVMHWLIILKYACAAVMCRPAAQRILLIILRYACDAVMCRPAAQRILLIILRYACDTVMCQPAAQRILLIIMSNNVPYVQGCYPNVCSRRGN
jgi:hypothetical protein